MNNLPEEKPSLAERIALVIFDLLSRVNVVSVKQKKNSFNPKQIPINNQNLLLITHQPHLKKVK